MLLNEYVLLVKEDGRILGRLIDEKGGINGFVVFPHRNIKNPKPGLLKISNIEIKINKNDNKSKCGFVDGEYIETLPINPEILNIKEKHAIMAMGYIKSMSVIENKEYILVKDELNCSKLYYAGFRTKQGIVFVNNLKYIADKSEYIRSLSNFDRVILKDMLTTPMRCLQDKHNEVYSSVSGINKSEMIDIVNPSYIYKRIIDIYETGLHLDIVLYLCTPNKNIDLEVYRSMVKHNKNVKATLLSIKEINVTCDAIDKALDILNFYNI